MTVNHLQPEGGETPNNRVPQNETPKNHPHTVRSGAGWLDEILKSVWADGTYTGGPYKDVDPITPQEAHAAITAKIAELLDSFSEIIGEDEDPENGRQQPGIYYRNNQRSEQRRQLAQLRDQWL